MNKYKLYLTQLFSGFIIVLTIVSIINFTVDPENIYQDSSYSKDQSSDYAEKLVNSHSGLLRPNNYLNDRDIKFNLIKQSNTSDCVIIGSSRAMQFSSYREDSSLDDTCKSILNLAVPGGSLEDYMVLSNEVSKYTQKYKIVIFVLDPWSFGFNRDARWERYKESYNEMLEKLALKKNDRHISDDLPWMQVSNLINPSYFFRSISSLGGESLGIREAPKFNYSSGYKVPVLLPDGSLIYSKKHISDSKLKSNSIGNGRYKIKENLQINSLAIASFKENILYLNESGLKVVLVMAPYHNKIWSVRNSVTVRTLSLVEKSIHEIGKELNVRILGSYRPDIVGCSADEFYDDIHPGALCISKIKN